MTKKGKLVTISGIDGSGKTSVLDFLKSELGEEQYLFTREPGGTPNGKRIREILLHQEDDLLDPLAEMLMFGADRAHHLKSVIGPALARGHTVISDRFHPDTYAYQLAGRQASEEVKQMFFTIHAPLLREIGSENIHCLLLDVDPTVAMRRMRDKGKPLDSIENRGLAFQERVQQGFVDFLEARHHGIAFNIINANQQLEVVQRQVLELVRKITS